jgi:bacillithiol system protein YtxJ
MPEKELVELHDTESLDLFLKGSNGRPLIIFKHSNSCGISARAYIEMANLEGPVGVITVQQSREVSAEIERRFGLSHETPQVLIVRDNELLWSASHSQVRARAVAAALESVSCEQ